jgi:hypothetical protein
MLKALVADHPRWTGACGPADPRPLDEAAGPLREGFPNEYRRALGEISPRR